MFCEEILLEALPKRGLNGRKENDMELASCIYQTG